MNQNSEQYFAFNIWSIESAKAVIDAASQVKRNLILQTSTKVFPQTDKEEVRFLIYLAQVYQMMIEKAERSLYGTGQISLPTPRCIVFYNGVKEMPEERTLKLLDAFENKKVRADVELQKKLFVEFGLEEGK